MGSKTHKSSSKQTTKLSPSYEAQSYLNNCFDRYGLRYVLLISLLVIYQFVGAVIFYVCEAPNDHRLKYLWQISLDENRTRLVQQIVSQIPYENLINLTEIETLKKYLTKEFLTYEQNLGARYTDQKMSWTFWNAMLYAQVSYKNAQLCIGIKTIYTTIGYGHLYASTQAGRLFTMLYALFGIPFVMSILDNFGNFIFVNCLKFLGKLFTKFLQKFWTFIQRFGSQTIKKLCLDKSTDNDKTVKNEESRNDEEELPLWLAFFVVVLWILICSATFCWWENEWDYFMAFYFFFISLSTIGLGDITPTEPRYLLMLFFYILIGLSLISMMLNLIQSKLERSYEHGIFCFPTASFNTSVGTRTNSSLSAAEDNSNMKGAKLLRRRPGGSSLGIFRGSGVGSGGSSGSQSKKTQPTKDTPLTRDALQAVWRSRTTQNKTSQTLLSFPLTTKTSNSRIARTLNSELSKSLSIDDVMRLVDTEEGDILLLKDLMKRDDESSGILSLSLSTQESSSINRENSSEFSTTSTSFAMEEYSRQRQKPSKSMNINAYLDSKIFTTTYAPILPNAMFATLIGNSHLCGPEGSNNPEQQQYCAIAQVMGLIPSATKNLCDLEILEELEDRVILSNSGSIEINPSVHFRSRLSLIPEQSSRIEEDFTTSNLSSCESSSYSRTSSMNSSSSIKISNEQQFLNVPSGKKANLKMPKTISSAIASSSSRSSGLSALFGSFFGLGGSGSGPETGKSQKRPSSNSEDLSSMA